MRNRIDLCFEQLRKQKRKAFIPYICAGDPTLDLTVRLSLAFEAEGADILELGLPFSDPLADGVANQLAAQRALAAGATAAGVLQAVEMIRKSSEIPIVLYSYLNPILQFGWKDFHRAAQSAGVDGLLILDLPPEEDLDDSGTGIAHIRLIAPTTSPKRRATIVKSARGFIYYVSRTGVTGGREKLQESLSREVASIGRESDVPVAVGFGISNPEQAAEVAKFADGVVVGSAIVEKIGANPTDPALVEKAAGMVRGFVEAVRTA